MPLTISNVVSPADAALKNKLYPQPLGPANPAGQFSLTGAQKPFNVGGGTQYGVQTSTAASTPNQGGLLNQLGYLSGQKTGQIQPAPVQTPYSSGGVNLNPFAVPTAQAQTTSGGASGSWTPNTQSPVSTATQPQQPMQPQQQPPQYNTPAPQIQQQAQTPSLFSQATQSLYDTSGNNAQIGRNAQQIADAAGKQISDIGGLGARSAMGYLTTGTSPVGEGNAAIQKQTTAAQQQAVAQGANVALQGNQQALSAQGQQQSGLASAAGLVQPQLGQYGQTYYNPQTGQASNGSSGGVSPNDPIYPALQQYAQMYATGQQAGIPGSITGNSVLNAQVLQMARAINPNFNINTVAGMASGQQQVGQQVAQMTAANTAAKGIEQAITSFIAQNPQLNPTDSTFANSISQWASGQQLGDPKYQTLANYLNEYISTLAPILGVGGNTTNLKTEIAQSMINARASGSSISEVLRNISTLADQKVANLASGGVGGGVVSGGGTDTGYNF